MIEVEVRDSSPDAFNKALSQFKKKVEADGFLQELKDRQYYKKPSEKNRDALRKRAYNLQIQKETK
jgi:small subunit ribosomal protein S21